MKENLSKERTMHEIIHLSLSAQSNHLTTHFYNAQESYFVFDERDVATKSHVDPTILFRAGVATDRRTPTFTPRALIWDMRGGYGSLKRSNGLYSDDYTNQSNAELSNVWEQGSTPLSVIKEDQVALSEYQRALDTGVEVLENAAKLSTQNTRYWSDYVNIYFNPKSFNQLANWEYDPVKFPQGKPRGEEPSNGRKFLDYEVGVTEFKDLNVASEDSYLETVFRPAIEECDSLNGVTIYTETDSAWGGFSSKVLEELREDYIPKSPVFTWGIYDNNLGAQIDHTTSFKNIKQSRQQVLSRIKTTMALARESTLFIPISRPQVPTTVLPNFDPTSNWHSTALFSLPVETMSLLSNLRQDNRRSMQSLTDSLQGGSNRNIVADVECSIVGPKLKDLDRKKLDFDFSGSVFKYDSSQEKRFFSKIGTLRPPSNTSPSTNDLSLANEAERDMLWEDLFHGTQLQDNGTSQALLSEIKCPQPFSLQKSFPASAINLEAEDSVFASLGITTAPRKYLKEMHTFVSKFVRTADEGRDELKEDTSNLAEQYEWGWNSSDEEEDDF